MRSSLVVLAALVLWMGRADAGRRRIVVLDFEGPKAEKFHSDVVKLVKKTHTVLTVDKWNDQADEMGASAVTDKNIKKVAKKLKIDGVITGKVEKRRDEYIVRLKLRSGSGGEVVGNTETKSSSARLDAQAQRDIKDELVVAIEDLEANRSGGGDEGEEEAEEEVAEEEVEEPKKSGFGKKGQMSADEDPKALAKKKKAEEEEAKRLAKEEEKQRKDNEKRAKEEEARLAKEDEKRKKDEDKRKKDEDKKAAQEAAFAKTKAKADEDEDEAADEPKADEEEEEEDADRKKKRVAARDDEEEEDDEESVTKRADVEQSGGRDLSPAGRAVDVVAGMSFTRRQLKFAYAGDLGKPPPGYKQTVPVAGGILDATVYPLAFGNTRGLLRGLGLTLLYDQVLVIKSQKKYSDMQGAQQIADLKTTENRWAVGPVLRYPLGKVVVGGALTYGRQQFQIAQTLPNMEPTDIPNVHYTMITPSLFLKYPVTSKIIVNADAAFHGITNTGQIQKTGMDGYGAATVTGYEVEGGLDYMVTKSIFARGSVRFESITFKFKGDPTSQSNIRDMDTEQDVTGAKDTYFGGTVTLGYVY